MVMFARRLTRQHATTWKRQTLTCTPDSRRLAVSMIRIPKWMCSDAAACPLTVQHMENHCATLHALTLCIMGVHAATQNGHLRTAAGKISTRKVGSTPVHGTMRRCRNGGLCPQNSLSRRGKISVLIGVHADVHWLDRITYRPTENVKDNPLFKPITLGRYTLRNRIVMPPLTRQRSGQPGDIPTDLMARYYRQRASAGFMITEATQIEPRGRGYAWAPGIYSPAQIDGWRKVVDAVHAEGGTLFLQLWHVGRVSHIALQPDGAPPIAPSAIQARNVKAFIETAPGVGSLIQPSMPRALTIAEIRELVSLYAQAAKNALEAGFDGVEIHAANGYLVNQFISAHANTRVDEYGGSLQNRLRFLREIVAAVSGIVGADRLGVRLSPLFTGTDQDRVYIGFVEDDPHRTYIEAIKLLEEAGVAYLSIAEPDWDHAPELPEDFRRDVRRAFSGRIMYAGHYTAARGIRLLEAGLADLIAFGRLFIANPDLPARIANGWPLNAFDRSTVYGGGAEGLTDYPPYSPADSIETEERLL
jgi:N-ethylmaleimide reductase